MILNEFRLVGDFLHDFAILLLIFNIIKTRSCHSVSGLTIILYTIVFSCRYLDLFQYNAFLSTTVLIYNNIFKVYYLLSSFFLLYLIYGLFRKTRDRSHETFPIFGYLIFAHILTWLTCYYTQHKQIDMEFFWGISVYLEIFAIIPQLILTYKQGTISKTMSYYLIMLGSYRAFYIINWIYRYNTDYTWYPIPFYSGCFQTIIYLYFFIRIYPRLNQSQTIESTKDLIQIIDTQENQILNQKTKDNMPLIHTFV